MVCEVFFCLILYLNFFRIKYVLDLNFETQVFIELLNNSNRIKTFDFCLKHVSNYHLN